MLYRLIIVYQLSKVLYLLVYYSKSVTLMPLLGLSPYCLFSFYIGSSYITIVGLYFNL
jgi:hypothetical protein